MYEIVYFEIVGFCNARCPWCITGNKSLDKAVYPSKSIEINEFEKAVAYLLDNGLIQPGKSVICLYNWGEPVLHPELNELLKILCRQNISFEISTNASKVVRLEDSVLSNLCCLEFSMPGFSQNSYDRIHGFNFAKILKNIETYCEDIRKVNPDARLKIDYHIYQFNIGEISTAIRFCKENSIDFDPCVAFLNDFGLAESYLDKSISKEKLLEISKDLLLYHVDELIAERPADYRCPQFDILTIDEYCNVLTCCAVPKDHDDYSLGKLFTLSSGDIRKGKESRAVCNKCLESGFAYWVQNQRVPEFVKNLEYLAFEGQILTEKDSELRKKDMIIDSMLNSRYYRFGRAIMWPIRYVKERVSKG